MCVWLPRRAQLSGLRLLRAQITQERAESVSLSLCSCSGPLAVVESLHYMTRRQISTAKVRSLRLTAELPVEPADDHAAASSTGHTLVGWSLGYSRAVCSGRTRWRDCIG